MLTRRDFVRTGLAGAAALTVVRPGRTQVPASDRIGMGFLGAGGIASAHLGGFLAAPDVEIRAVCDPRRDRREAMAAQVDQHYGTKGCRAYNDFRDVLTRPDIDAVLVATPDHWHALLTIAAAQAGKHMYSEKPFCRTVAEGRAMVQAIARHRVVFQHGTQQRSDGRFRRACELVRNGRLGKLHTVRVVVPLGQQGPNGTIGPPPEGVDWDLWLGPAPWSPYSPERIENMQWFHIEDYSAGGYVSGWGIHHVDIQQWGMGTELTGPVELEGTATFPTDGLCDAPITWHVEYHFGSGPRVIFTSDEAAPDGVTFEGDEGSLWVTRGAWSSRPAALTESADDAG
ncbi:MAG: Gfo/Idh/MocA family oxidoreductase, partial [Armatimonadetes bacterium]|nr:Gfo/Idh/MocA family oxidoreductase [Armatimonadota bacterium]